MEGGGSRIRRLGATLLEKGERWVVGSKRISGKGLAKAREASRARDSRMPRGKVSFIRMRDNRLIAPSTTGHSTIGCCVESASRIDRP